MQVDQVLLDMPASADQGCASAGTSTQPANGDQDAKMSDSASKKSEGPNSLSKSSEGGPMDGGSKEPLSDKRERD